ncbi:MAG: ABC transporter ATP-binding protein/permease [Lachnospiraceae bacterium]|jgi:ATP-binding cassette subfamily B protein|nr:ABC transporter ATP-binding protein/permease [Lachnospiraceae bacterium]
MARNKIEVDETLDSEFSMAHLKRLFGYIALYRRDLTLTLIVMLTCSALGLLSPVILKQIIDVYIPNEDIRGIINISIAFLMISLVIVVGARLRITLTSRIGQGIIHKIREDIFCHLQELPFDYYDNRPHGKILVRVVNYVNSLSELLSNGIVNTITELCSLFFIIGFMLMHDVRLTLVCLVGLPVLMGVVFFIKTRQRQAWQVLSNKTSNLNAYIAESMNGIRVTQSFVREEENIRIFNSLSSNYRDAWMGAIKLTFLIWPAADNIAAWTTAIIYVLGVNWISGGDALTAGTLILFTAYIGRFWMPINVLAGFYNSLVTAMSYMERIFETIDEPVEVHDSEGAVEMPEITGHVEFRDVVFAYGKNSADGEQSGEENDTRVIVLDGVSFTAAPGQSFAIVGSTGAGKTTIINVLSRFYNLNSGAILIDGIDISIVTIKSLRRQMGVMLQDSFIFSGTIADNIRYGNLTATDEQIMAAAKTVCAHDFIIGLEDGYETKVNERGTRLSAGQRQLVSFARTLLADPRILILDEATSNIDTETELLLQRGLAALLKGRTSFVIAHRLSTIQKSDCILYLEDGRIAESGNHETLMAAKGLYYDLNMSQV